MDNVELKARTLRFGIAVIRFVDTLNRSAMARPLGNQLLRSGTSVGANYRAACRARSRADFISKLKIVEEECDEALYWLQLLTDSRLATTEAVQPLSKEADELLAIIVATIRTARKND